MDSHYTTSLVARLSIQRLATLLLSLQIPSHNPPLVKPNQTKPSPAIRPQSTKPHKFCISFDLQHLDFQDMEFLEFQLFEPISLRFYSLTASSSGGSLLTWIAVLAAAAVGFWRIRIVGSKADDSDAATLFTAPVPLEEAQQKVVPVVQNTKNEASLSSSCSVFDRSVEMVCTPKVRFTAYFEEEHDCIGCCHVEDEEEEATVDVAEEFGHREVEVEVSREIEEMEVKWEDMMVLRRGDLGWYCYQDMAMLNGSVVRLWDGDRPRRRKGSIAISSF